MSGATFLIFKCCCEGAVEYVIYVPCCDAEGPHYWAIDYGAGTIMVGDVCYWPKFTSSDIEGLSELPTTGDPCECDCPEPPYVIFGSCCDGTTTGTHWATVEEVSSYSTPFMIDGECAAAIATTTDPDDIVGLTHFTGGSCGCRNPVFNPVQNSELCTQACMSCCDIYVGVEIIKGGDTIDIGYWKFDGSEYPYYFVDAEGESCGSPPPWVGQSGWKCDGNDVVNASTFGPVYIALKNCPYSPPSYGLVSHSFDSFTWGGDPECP